MGNFNFEGIENAHYGACLVLDLFVKGALLAMFISISCALISFIAKRKD